MEPQVRLGPPKVNQRRRFTGFGSLVYCCGCEGRGAKGQRRGHHTQQQVADHAVWRLGLHRPPCGARPRQDRRAHAGRGEAPRACRPSPAARRRGPDQRRAGQCALSRFAARRSGRRRCRGQSGRHLVSVRQADLQMRCRTKARGTSRRQHARPAQERWCMSRRSAPARTRASVYARSKAAGEDGGGGRVSPMPSF